MRKGFGRKPETGLTADCIAVCAYFGQSGFIVIRIGHDSDIPIILRGSAQHRRPADIDLFKRVFKRAIRLRNGLRKWIKIDRQQINPANAMFFQRAAMRVRIAPRARGQTRRFPFYWKRTEALVESLWNYLSSPYSCSFLRSVLRLMPKDSAACD